MTDTFGWNTPVPSPWVTFNMQNALRKAVRKEPKELATEDVEEQCSDLQINEETC